MTQKSSIYALIMAGGQGTRLWPESTPECPKQFSKVFGENSLLQETFLRLEEQIPKEKIYIITTQSQKDLCLDQLGDRVTEKQIILEPEGRNTAPCVFLGLQALIARDVSLESSIAVLPSDHIILDKSGFHKTLSLASECASKEKGISTIGIKPHFPHIGYGYIEKAQELQTSAFKVKQFVEKPDLETAKKYLASGKFAWNAGMFVGDLSTWLDAYETYSPEMSSSAKKLQTALKEDKDYRAIYSTLKAESIDYEIMEKHPNIICVEANFDWNDLGSWSALEASFKGSDTGNIVFNGNQKVVEIEASGNIVKTHQQVVALCGVQDLIIINSRAGLLVVPKDKSQKVKEIVSRLNKS